MKNSSVTVMGWTLCRCCPRRRRLVLRQVILLRARHAVIIGPAVDHRQLLAEIAMTGRCLRRLPLERRRLPGVAWGAFSFEKAPDQIEEEHELSSADHEGCDGDELVQPVNTWRYERRVGE